jgi:hypothetical protein
MLAVLSGHFSMFTLACCYLSDFNIIVADPAGILPLEDFK